MVTTFKNGLRYLVYSILFVLYIILCAKDASAQTSDKLEIVQAPVNVKVDGRMEEWGDSLAYYNKDTKLSYAIAKNDTALYIAVTAADRQVKRKIMMAGITVTVNTEGKKHKMYSLTYPLPDNNGSGAFGRGKSDDTAANFQPKPSLLQTTSLKVEGFKDVESDVITTANTYGFKAAYKFDNHHNLVYEIAIPLNMLNLKPKNKELAVNIMVNGVTRPSNPNKGNNSFGGGGMRGEGGGMGMGGGMGGSGGMGGGRGGRGGGNRGGEGSGDSGESKQGQSAEMAQSADFWIRAELPQ